MKRHIPHCFPSNKPKIHLKELKKDQKEAKKVSESNPGALGIFF